MSPAAEAAWTLGALAAQTALVIWGMVRVTAPGVPGNSFRKNGALYLGTVPLLGLVVAWRTRGIVRLHALRIQVFTLGVGVVDLVVAAVG